MPRVSRAKVEETNKSFEALRKELLRTNKRFRNDLAFDEVKIQVAMEMVNARHERNILQRQLAKLAERDQGLISRIERMEANPTLKLIAEIAVAMNKKVVIRFEDFEDFEDFEGSKK